jgi:hypothetical protein
MNLYVIIDVDKNQIDIRTVKGRSTGSLRVYPDIKTAELALKQMIKTDRKNRKYRIAEYSELPTSRLTG